MYDWFVVNARGCSCLSHALAQYAELADSQREAAESEVRHHLDRFEEFVS
jgi:hypothetical protein